jgi:hypothetical protein
VSAVLVRITLRYLSGLLIGKGLLSADMSDLFLDPDLVTWLTLGAGVVLGVITEGMYALAKRFGWAT